MVTTMMMMCLPHVSVIHCVSVFVTSFVRICSTTNATYRAV